VTVQVRDAAAADSTFVDVTVTDSWGAPYVVSYGKKYDVRTLPAFIAEQDGERVGLLTYDVSDDGFCVVSLDALVRRRGIGSALLSHATDVARRQGCSRIWLTTSNELIDALTFYLRQGMRLIEVVVDGMDAERRLKPEIPTHADDGTPIRDVWVLEKQL